MKGFVILKHKILFKFLKDLLKNLSSYTFYQKGLLDYRTTEA